MEKLSNILLGFVAASFLVLTLMCFNVQADNIKDNCMDKWGNNRVMVKSCIDRYSIEKQRMFVDILDKKYPVDGTTRANINIDCGDKYFDETYGWYDWEKVFKCCEKQYKAYDLIHGSE